MNFAFYIVNFILGFLCGGVFAKDIARDEYKSCIEKSMTHEQCAKLFIYTEEK